MVQNEKLVRCYELLGLASESSLEECHRAYLQQLDTWNPNAIDEDANPALMAEVRQRRQAIDQAHRYIVEQAEQGQAGATPGTGRASSSAVTVPELEDPDSEAEPLAGADPENGLSRDEESDQDDAGRTELSQAEPDKVNAEAEDPDNPFVPLEETEQELSAALPKQGTFVQSEGEILPQTPMPSGPLPSQLQPPVLNENSRVAPSHDAAELPDKAAVVQLLRWDKPTGRAILMIPALWAAFLATNGGPIPWGIMAIIVLGSIATSAAGCAANDLWDQDFDAQVERTQNRPLASGRLSRRNAQIILAISSILSIILALLLDWASVRLCVAAGIVILLYPAAKRVFPVPQLVLAIAWGFAVLIGWSAVTQGSLTFATFLLWAATVLWTLGFDTVYAMADQDDDRRIGLNSSALFFGDLTPDAVGLFFVGTAVMMFWLGLNLGLAWPFWLALILSILGWFKQHSRLSRSKHRPTTRLYGDIFTQNVWLGFLLLLGMILGQPLT